MTALKHLDLSYNAIKGSIPESFGNLTRLTKVYLVNNGLSGNLPAGITRLRNLQVMVLSGNPLALHDLPSKIGRTCLKNTTSELSYSLC